MIFFVVLISAPAVIFAIDDSIDLSSFYSISEEEVEKQDNEKNKELKDIKSFEFLTSTLHSESKVCSASFYELRIYSKPYLNLFSPPPKFS